MRYKTLDGVLNPDGRVTLPPHELPEHPVRVMITIVESGEEEVLSDVSDYLDQLSDHEDRLARGGIQWR